MGNPKRWGRAVWDSLHYIAEGYPEKPTAEDMKHYEDFVTNLAYVLPCRHCRESFHVFIKQIPPYPYLYSRDQFTRWIYIMHTRVTEKLIRQGGKNPKTRIPTYEAVRAMYRDKPKQHGGRKPK